RSTILPFPSSPHCAPSTAMFIGAVFYLQPSRAGARIRGARRSTQARCPEPMILRDGATLTLAQLLAVADEGVRVGLTADAVTRVDAARVVVDRMRSEEHTSELQSLA